MCTSGRSLAWSRAALSQLAGTVVYDDAAFVVPCGFQLSARNLVYQVPHGQGRKSLSVTTLCRADFPKACGILVDSTRVFLDVDFIVTPLEFPLSEA